MKIEIMLETGLLRLPPGMVLGLVCLVSPWIGIALLIGVGFTGLALTRPIILGYLMITVIALASSMERGRIVPFLIPNEAVLVLALIMLYPVLMVNRWRSNIPSNLFWAIVAYVAGTVVIPLFEYMFRGINLSIDDIFAMIAPLQYIVLFVIFSYLPRNDDDRMGLIQWMLVCAAVIAIVGLLQAFSFGPVDTLLATFYAGNHIGAASDAGRVTSLLGAWNVLGTFLMFMILIILALQPTIKRRLYKVNSSVVMILSSACLLASGSFASIGGAVVGTILVKIFNPKGLRILLYMVIGVVIALLLLYPLIAVRLAYQFEDSTGATSLVPQTFAYRLYVWENIFYPVIGEHFPWGVHPNLTGAHLTWGWPESQYLFLLFRGGLSALIGHIIWILVTCVWLFKKMRHSQNELIKNLAIVAFTMLIVLSVMGFTNEVFVFSVVIDYIWILLGIILSGDKKKNVEAD